MKRVGLLGRHRGLVSVTIVSSFITKTSVLIVEVLGKQYPQTFQGLM